jgi:hypothetical protein
MIVNLSDEPIDATLPPLFPWADQTMRGWLAKSGANTERILTKSLRVRMEIGTEVYDATRDAMVAPMTFWLKRHLKINSN